jgi:molybdopterin-containing oxidoreductase family iron-sulfur binding subunit
MEDSRRQFLKIAGVAALGMSAVRVIDAAAASEGHSAQPHVRKGDDALTATQWGMVIYTAKLDHERIERMINACNTAHNVPDISAEKVGEKTAIRHQIKWIWETHFHNAFPGLGSNYMSEEVEEHPFLVLCNHCEEPPCTQACPTQATFKRPDGIVMMDFHRCIGCRFCMAACPYGSRSFNFRDPRPFIDKLNPNFPTRTKGVVEKCNFCAERLAVGQIPACVEAAEGAVVFGDLGDPHSEIREVLRENYTIRRKVSLGTGPAVYYII